MNCRHGLHAPGVTLLAHGETNRPPGCVAVLEYYDVARKSKLIVADWVSADGYEQGWYRSAGVRGKLDIPHDEEVAFVRSKVIAFAIKQQEAV